MAAGEDPVGFRTVRSDAGQVRHRLDPVFSLDQTDQFDGSLSGVPSCTIGYRNKRGREGLQFADGLEELLEPDLGLRREKFKGENGFSRIEMFWNFHAKLTVLVWSSIDSPGASRSPRPFPGDGGSETLSRKLRIITSNSTSFSGKCKRN